MSKFLRCDCGSKLLLGRKVEGHQYVEVRDGFAREVVYNNLYQNPAFREVLECTNINCWNKYEVIREEGIIKKGEIINE
jgi:hypothetical protein